jgi:hypothetical protein
MQINIEGASGGRLCDTAPAMAEKLAEKLVEKLVHPPM